MPAVLVAVNTVLVKVASRWLVLLAWSLLGAP